MTFLLAPLLALKFGCYLGAKDAPFKTWFYMSMWKQAPKAWAVYPLGLEAGWTIEPTREAIEVLSFRGTKDTYLPAYFAGLAVPYKNDITFSLGLKYKNGVQRQSKTTPYAAASIRFGTLR